MKYSIIFTTVITLALTSQLVTAGSIGDTYTAGDTLTATKMENIKTAVNDNDGNVSTNTTNIGTNTTGIAGNTTNIETNTVGIGANTVGIGANTTAIGVNTTNITGNTTNIGTNTVGIGANTTAIGVNTTNITGNTTNIGTNTAGIADNTTNIGTNTTGIDSNTTEIATNVLEIANNSSVIAGIFEYLLGGNSPYINAQETLIQAAGWEICASGPYDGSAGNTITDVLSTCSKANLMLACRQIGSPIFTLAAWAPRADVTFDTGVDTTTTHNANGAEWYFNNSYSWGFALGGDTVNKVSCDLDTTNPDYRMCLHTSADNITSGYRCGNNFLNGDATWERVILHKD